MSNVPQFKKIIDISRELLSTEPFPGDPAPKATLLADFESDVYQLTALCATVHSATHIDAPLHFIKGGKDIASLTPDIFLGKCTVAELEKEPFEKLLEKSESCERLLLKGSTIVDTEAAAKLAELPFLKLVGVEKNSIGSEKAPMAAHLALLGKGIAIIENLDLSAAREGEYFLCALPLKIEGCEASPCRAVLIEF